MSQPTDRYGDDIKSSVACFIGERSHPRFLAKKNRHGEPLVFVYQKLEEIILDEAKCSKDDSIRHHDLADAVKRVHTSMLAKAWVSMSDAVIDYSLTPKGFLKGQVYSDNGAQVGHVLISENDGVLIPFIAKNSAEFVALVEAIILGESVNKLFDEFHQANQDKQALVSIKLASGRAFIAFAEGARIVKSMAFGEQLKARDFLLYSPPNPAPLWADETLISLGPVAVWDEDAPLIVEIMQETSTKPYVQKWGRALKRDYERDSHPATILKNWISFSEDAVASTSREEIANAVGQVIAADDPDPLAHHGQSIQEWMLNQSSKTNPYTEDAGPTGGERGVFHGQVERAISSNYPELIGFKTSSVAWAWQDYIHKLKNASADIVHDDKYRMDRNGRSCLFLCYILFSATVTAYLPIEVRSDHRRVVSASPGGLDVDAVNFFYGLGKLTFIASNSRKHHAEDVIFDFCYSLRRLISSVKAGWSLSQAIAEPSVGYIVLSELDRAYCKARDIPSSLPVTYNHKGVPDV